MPFIMWLICLCAVALVLSLGGLVLARDKSGPAVAAFFSVVALAVFWVIGVITPVSTRQYCVITSYGKPTGEVMNNGLHTTYPWEVCNEMDGAVQIDKYVKDGGDDHRVTVRLGNSTLAKADVSIRWQIKESAAPELYQQYKEFSNVRTNLIERNLSVALNNEFAHLNPLDPKNLDKSPLPDIQAAALADMKHDVGSQVDVFDIQLPTIEYDNDTESKISGINAQRARTTIANEEEQTNNAQARANAAISASIDNNPAVVANNCINKAVDKGISPLGCWPGSQAMVTTPAPSPQH